MIWLIILAVFLRLSFGRIMFDEPCPSSVWNKVGQMCYLQVNTSKSWSEAKEHCWRHNAHLVRILNDDLNLDRPETDLVGRWIGLHVFNGKLWWEGRRPFAMTPLGEKYLWSEQPRNLADDSCGTVVEFTSGIFYLKMLPCSLPKFFTCFRYTRIEITGDEKKCRPNWLSERSLDYCFILVRSKKSYEEAGFYCKNQNSVLWDSAKEYDEAVTRRYLRAQNLSGLAFIHRRQHDPCASMDKSERNCLVEKHFFCQEPAKNYSPNVELKIKSLSKNPIQVSEDVFLVNFDDASSTIIECPVYFQDGMWLKNGLFHRFIGDQEISLTRLSDPRTLFNDLYHSQGMHGCSVDVYKHGKTISNNVTVILNDVLTTWIYVAIEIPEKIDLSPYVLPENHKILRKLSIDPKVPYAYLEGGLESYLYLDSTIKSRKEDIIDQELNIFTLKFGLWTKIEDGPTYQDLYKPELRKHQIDYMTAYLKEVQDVVENQLMMQVGNGANRIFKAFDLLDDTPSEIIHGDEYYKKSYIKDTRICFSESLMTPEGPLRFEAGLAGEYVNSSSLCPNSELSPLALGLCKGNFLDGYNWEVVKFHRCNPEKNAMSEVTDDLSEILNTLDPKTEKNTIEEVARISRSQQTKLTFVDVRIIAEIALSASKSTNNLDEMDDTLTDIVSNVMLVPVNESSSFSHKENMSRSKFRLSKSLESMIENIQLNGSQLMWPTKQFTVQIVKGTNESHSFGLVTPGDKDEPEYFLQGDSVSKSVAINAGITIPASAYQTLHNQNEETRTSFIVYKSNFLLSNLYCQSEGCETLSFIVSGSIKGRPISNLTEKIKLRFKITESNKSYVCAFTKEDDDGINWHWSTEGITTEHYDNITGILECSSNHLTNFAVIAGFLGDPGTQVAKVLSYISIIGMVVSVICLSLAVMCQMFFKKFRKGQFQIALLNLSIALIVVNLLVLLGLDRTSNRTGCIIVAALLHYFLLVSFAWMLIEAILQYYKFVKVFNVHVSKFVLKTILPAWTLPAVIVGITAFIDYNLFRGPNHYCWLAKEAFNYAFLLPLGLIIVANTFTFVWIIKGISCDRPKGMQTNQTKSRLVWLQVQAGICCFIVMGLTWSFALFAFGKAALVMQFLFAIFNSLQGFFIFLLFNLREKQVRKAWYDLVCGRKGGKKGISSGSSPGLISRDFKKDMRDDVVFTSSDECTFKNTNSTNDTFSK